MKKQQYTPLAERMRPQTIDDIFGQEKALSENGLIQRSIKSKKPLSMILWGPPGCGKTSLANLYAKAFAMRFVKMSAIFSGIGDIKKIVKDEQKEPLLSHGVFLFVDEIHRFNKAQQDAFLPFLENGTIHLIGATTENPSFYLNNALLSRLRVIALGSLDEKALTQLIDHYEKHYTTLNLTKNAKDLLIQRAQGDGRYLLNLIENIDTAESNGEVDAKELDELLQKRSPLFDKGDDQHYNLISALHKSVRGSDVDASLYWFARMLEGGEDPRYLARRLIRMATEDIGLADPEALPLAIAAKEAYEMQGSPEGELALAEVVVYLALAPKSNAIYKAFKKARAIASTTTHYNPPKIILNAPNKMMKEMGYGKGYLYDHDQKDGFSGQNYFPDEMERQTFYEPVERGFEREMGKRLVYFNKYRENK